MTQVVQDTGVAVFSFMKESYENFRRAGSSINAALGRAVVESRCEGYYECDIAFARTLLREELGLRIFGARR